MPILLNTSKDWFDELAVKIINTLLRLRIGGAPQPGKVRVFDFDEYRNGGSAVAVLVLLVAFSEKCKQATIHSLSALSGFVVMSSEQYDFSVIRAVDPDPEIKIRYLAAILRREFGG